jgi:hypothetical protein
LPISAVDTISLAVEHTKQQLFKPFRLGQWVKLAFVGLLAGELGSGGNFNFNSGFPRQTGGSAPSWHPGLAGLNLALVAALVAVIVVAALVIGIILMYISSVMRFILFDSVLARECHIRDGWNHRQGPGWRYFVWKLLYALFTLAGMALLIGIPAAFAFAAGWFNQPKTHLLPLILGGVLVFFVVMLFALFTGVVFVLTKDFVIPQMALEEITVMEGWRRLWPMIQSEKGSYAGYIGMKIVMAIGAGIMVGIATLILGLIIAIPTVGLSIIAIFTGKTAGLTWNVYTISLAIVVGSVLISIFLFLVSLLSVPFIVFFPAYSIYFFAARYPALGAVLYPAASPALNAIPAPPPPPQQPPPLPSAPEPIG